MRIDPDGEIEARDFIIKLLTRDVLRDKLDKLERGIKDILPTVDVDAAKLVYYTSDKDSGKDIEKMMKDPEIGFKDLPVSDQTSLIEKIRGAVGLAKEIKDSTNEGLVNKYMAELKEAMKSRRTELVSISNKVCGIYDFDENFDVVISNHPFDIMAKSSGQGWSRKSSESLCSSRSSSCQFAGGIFSDIQNGSAIAFLVVKASGHVNARVMLRVCGGENEKGMGVEKQVYFDNGNQGDHADVGSGKMIARGVKAKDFHAYIIKILEAAGLMEYNVCTTPYVYKGYSDVARSSNTMIEYKRPKVDTSSVRSKKTRGSGGKSFYK